MFGIVVSIIGITGGIYSAIKMPLAGVFLLFMIPYLILWSLLFNKTSIQDIHSIERIGKVYSFVTGALEIIGAIASIITNSKYDIENHELYIKNHDYQSYIENQYMYRSLIVGSVIYLIMACVKIHGIRVENNELLGTYLGFRYKLFILSMILFIIFIDSADILVISVVIAVIILFIKDIGLIVILHSIHSIKQNTARTENEDEEPLLNRI